MRTSIAPQNDNIERAVRDVLGLARVRSVDSEVKVNDDGAAIVRVRVVYNAAKGLTVKEMEQIADAIWPSDAADGAPFPVIDFQEDTDVEPVAAE